MTTLTLSQFADGFISDSRFTKRLSYYQKYEDYFRKHKFSPSTIFEIGVFHGESTKVFAKVFPDAHIVAIDLHLSDIDFSDYPNVIYLQADQTDKSTLEAIISKEFPNGIDLVIDDASHIGALSKATFDIVFPFVKVGGVYVIEDWGTGYLDNWSDGVAFQRYDTEFVGGKMRIPSHDFGMVGFVKSLVDSTHRLTQSGVVKSLVDSTHRLTQNGVVPPISSLEFTSGICFVLKGAALGQQQSALRRPMQHRKQKLKDVLRAVRDLVK